MPGIKGSIVDQVRIKQFRDGPQRQKPWKVSYDTSLMDHVRDMANLRVWNERAEKYRFYAETQIKHPRPEAAEKALEDTGHFMCVPFPGRGVAWWGFNSERARDKFVEYVRKSGMEAREL